MIHQNNSIFFFLVVLTFFIVSSSASFGYSVGLSPNKIIFDTNEKSLFIFNPNNFDISYNIIGCNYEFLEYLNQGRISKNSKRKLLFRYNPLLNSEVKNCTFDILFSNNLYSTGFSLKLYFSHFGEQSTALSSSSFIQDFLSEEERLSPDLIVKQSRKLMIIIVSSIVFIVGLIMIFKFM